MRRDFSILRPLRILTVVFAIFGSLIAFPCHVSWVVVFWLGCFLILAQFGFRGWLPLVLLAAILLIKRLNWTFSLWGLMAACIGIAWMRYRLPDEQVAKRFSAKSSLASLILIGLGAWFVSDRYLAANGSAESTSFDAARPVACLGDSLTAYGYPKELAKLIAVPVEDFGVNGIDTDDGIALLPKLAAVNPQLVVIELGGHDYNQGSTREKTLRNLERLILECKKMDARVVLVEIPCGL